ncbi:Asp-tRNA(Asn)/Glu-tRNA(Gln) amidotransferase GatCAB subunit A [Candidatus Woesearchaeota archaeon]|jgi:aspartyl-tRNA(Asn)/glutamyl-tRNA(Gln) amidotransferase subunit A|nr:Asp-tRNA(Asn)/Glu-tRNA(Gln) amidotransferase GatCAB subunit A [Candidatus Woesearchaeota archaeon]MDP6647966.1 amidase family protein [Candidatus Woesearchaeota archaeon]|tara:strand:+ start:3797 stop:5242 length:1446 start_codon:yes stop_codon:yes gene_type:complete
MQCSEFVEKVKNNEIDIVEHTHKVIEECKKINKDYNYFNVVSEELALVQANKLKKLINGKKADNKKLLGVPVSVKDNICVKGVESTAGSRILKGYKPLFNATAVENAINQGAIVIGKTSQDEFGFGGFSVNAGLGFKIPKNPFDKERSCGGSSGGAGGLAQKATFPHIALGESTGGSIACPANFCGVFGLTPTYGIVSRYGLIDYGNSLDKIGTLGKSSNDAGLLQEVISGYDEKDSTSLNVENERYTEYLGGSVEGLKVGIIKEAFGKGNEKAVENQVYKGIETLKEKGVKAEEISLEMPIKYGLATYYMIATSEASTNLAKYCGMRYGAAEKLRGSFNEYFTKVRSKNFGDEAKRRVILGTFARMAGHRDAFYIKAAKVRTKIINEYKKAFKQFDALISPTVPILPPKFSEIEKLTPLQNYMIDSILVGPNIAGLPHLSVPIGYDQNLPVGMLLTGDHLQEKKLLQLGNLFETTKFHSS